MSASRIPEPGKIVWRFARRVATNLSEIVCSACRFPIVGDHHDAYCRSCGALFTGGPER